MPPRPPHWARPSVLPSMLRHTVHARWNSVRHAVRRELLRQQLLRDAVLPSEFAVFDLPAGMTAADRRAEAEWWCTQQLEAYALPDTLSHIMFGVCETGDEVSSSIGQWTQLRSVWWNAGFDEVLAAVDAWPLEQPVTVWSLPLAHVLRLPPGGLPN